MKSASIKGLILKFLLKSNKINIEKGTDLIFQLRNRMCCFFLGIKPIKFGWRIQATRRNIMTSMLIKRTSKAKEKYAMRKKIISLFMAICMTVMLIPSSVLPVLAQTTQAEDWNGSQTTGNLIPTMNEGDTLTAVGWGNIGDQIRLTAYEIDDGDYTNKIGIQARNTSHDIGNKDYTGGVYWQIDFSDEDKVKINKGDIFLSASARYWIQASSDGYLSLRFEFFNAQNILLDDSHKKHIQIIG